MSVCWIDAFKPRTSRRLGSELYQAIWHCTRVRYWFYANINYESTQRTVNGFENAPINRATDVSQSNLAIGGRLNGAVKQRGSTPLA